MNKRILSTAAAISLLLAACGNGTPEVGGTLTTAVPLAAPDLENPALREIADSVCRAAVWTGIASGRSFQAELDDAAVAGISELDVADAVQEECPDAFYEPLVPAELDWCGSGEVLSRNFLKVVESGVDLKLPSFSVVDLPLLRKASRVGANLSDYEIELFTVEIVSMAATSGFSRDWAAACRATL